MVEAIHRIGRVMGKQTIAESVETVAIRDALATVGVDYGQGYAIAMPAPFELTAAADGARGQRRATG
jgi:EAL domain-containing protein (putative c-di-GMP-specific phosphodiesterase class I)